MTDITARRKLVIRARLFQRSPDELNFRRKEALAGQGGSHGDEETQLKQKLDEVKQERGSLVEEGWL